MTGNIDLGSVVFEKVEPVSDLRVGDIITYQPPAVSGIDHLVTHRIIAIKGDKFRTQGDAVPQRDPWTFELVARDQPRVSFSVPYVGFLFLALADRTIRMAVISVPAALVFLLAMRQLAQGLRRRPTPAPTPGGPTLVGG
jgi:signal peptidase